MERLTITRLGHLGDGIAETPAGPVFAAKTLPGEIIDGARTGDRIEAPRIVTPAPQRIKPPCPHYASCGGCAVMHASDAFVAAWKTETIQTALTAQGLTAPIRPILTSPIRSRRRATLAGRRTKKGALVGFHARKSDTIVPIGDCFVLAQPLTDCLPELIPLTRACGSRSGTLAFALTLTDTGIDLAIGGGKPLDRDLLATLPELTQGFARVSYGTDPLFTRETPSLRLGPARATPPPGGFLQATTHGQTALQAAVTQATQGATAIVDLFSGIGTFTLALATETPVHAVESDPAALQALTQAAHHTPGLKSITTETRDLFRRPLDPQDLQRFDAAVIDPPRAGAEAQTRALAQARLPQIAAVSCNPVTFARDAKILTQAGYSLDWVQPVDQFRWSAHVELAARFHLTHIQA